MSQNKKQYTITIVKRHRNKFISVVITGDAWDILMALSECFNKQKFKHWLDYLISNKPNNILERFCSIHYKELILKRHFRFTIESIEIVDNTKRTKMVKFNPHYTKGITLTQQQNITYYEN